MPSAEHETPIALAHQDPDLVATLLTHLFDLKLPDYTHARTHPGEVRVLVPRTYHADGVVLCCDPNDQPLLATVLEVQRSRDADKLPRWKLYTAQLETELAVDAALVVFCPEPALAQWYRTLVAPGGYSCLTLRPLIFTAADVPLVTDVSMAWAHPAWVVLSALCHGHAQGVDAVFPALAEVLRTQQTSPAIVYYDLVLAGLPPAARTRWEEFMTTTLGHEYRSNLLREIATQHEQTGEARGEARGEAHAVVTVLETRGVPIPTETREHILACTDATQLETWLRRATTATTITDVIDVVDE